MVTKAFLTIFFLSVTGSIGYILLKLLVTFGGSRLSQGWRYHGVAAVSTFFILPFYKLGASISVTLLSIIPNGSASEPFFMPVSSVAGELAPPSYAMQPGVDWGSVINCVSFLWLSLTSGLMLWNVWRILYYRRLVEQNCIEASEHLQRIAEDEAHLAGMHSKVRLLVSSKVQTPMLIGFFSPVILLPSGQITDRDARFILTHELTHFRRKDLWKKLLVSTVQCIHWFNPFVYMLNRDFLYWLETSCDEHVVRFLSRDQRKEYGHLLINYAPVFRHAGSRQYVSFTSCRHKLERRISIMLKSNMLKFNKRFHFLLGLVLAAALVAGGMATSVLAANIDVDSEPDTFKVYSLESSSASSAITQRVEETAAMPVDEEMVEYTATVDISTFLTVDPTDRGQ